MDPALVLIVAAAAAGLLAAAFLGVLLAVLAGRRRLRRDLAESRARIEELACRVEELQAPPPVEDRRPAAVDDTEYLITSVGHPAPVEPVEPAEPAEPVTAQQFVSIAVGESLVRIVSLGYGVRRALSAENRNRIRFEMRREIRRSRKQRRRDLKQARHHLRTAGVTAEDAA